MLTGSLMALTAWMPLTATIFTISCAPRCSLRCSLCSSSGCASRTDEFPRHPHMCSCQNHIARTAPPSPRTARGITMQSNCFSMILNILVRILPIWLSHAAITSMATTMLSPAVNAGMSPLDLHSSNYLVPLKFSCTLHHIVMRLCASSLHKSCRVHGVVCEDSCVGGACV